MRIANFQQSKDKKYYYVILDKLCISLRFRKIILKVDVDKLRVRKRD